MVLCNIAHLREIFFSKAFALDPPGSSIPNDAAAPFDFMFASVAWATDRPAIAVP